MVHRNTEERVTQSGAMLQGEMGVTTPKKTFMIIACKNEYAEKSDLKEVVQH